MHNGFKKVALGITGVALLSGTTFAVGPTVNNPPTLIITDRIKESSVLDLGGTGAIFEGNPTNASDTQNIYRFTEAFSLSDYISLSEGAGLADVKWDFAEVDASDNIVGVSTIEIDDGTNVSTGLASEPTFSDVNSSAFATVGAADPLTFRNVPRSTGSGPAVADFVDETKIKLFATNVNDTGSQVISTTFDVITTNDTNVAIGDTISGPSTIFTPVAAYDDLDGWYSVFNLGVGPLLTEAPYILSETVALPTITPAAGDLVSGGGTLGINVTPPNTEEVIIQTDTNTPTAANTSISAIQVFSPQLASWGSFTEDVGGDRFTAAADTIYMTRWSLVSPYSAGQAVQLPEIDLSVGSSTEFDLGRSATVVGRNSLANLYGNRDYNIFFYAHAAGEVGFYLSVFDADGNNSTNYPNGHVGHNLGVDKIEVFAFDESDLSGKTVVLNQGGASGSGNFIPASGQPAVDNTDYEGEFDLDLWMWVDERQGLRDFIGASATRNTSSTPVNPVEFRAAESLTAAELSTTVPTGNGFVQPYWSTIGSFFVNADGGPAQLALSATEDELVVADFWISSPNALVFPQSRVGIQTSSIDPSGGTQTVNGTETPTGLAGFYVFTATPTGLARSDGSLSTQATSLGAGAKRARYVFQPQITWGSIPGYSGDASALAFQPRAELYSAPGPFGATAPVVQEDREGTLRLHRVIVTTYDLPADVDTVTVPAGLTDQ